LKFIATQLCYRLTQRKP